MDDMVLVKVDEHVKELLRGINKRRVYTHDILDDFIGDNIIFERAYVGLEVSSLDVLSDDVVV
jgi:hypothetical protein